MQDNNNQFYSQQNDGNEQLQLSQEQYEQIIQMIGSGELQHLTAEQVQELQKLAMHQGHPNDEFANQQAYQYGNEQYFSQNPEQDEFAELRQQLQAKGINIASLEQAGIHISNLQSLTDEQIMQLAQI